MSNIYALQRFKWENLSAEEQQNLQRSVCTLLERPSAPGLYLKKMQGGDDLVWSFRVNDHKRVLFTYYREDYKTHLVLLAYYNDHDRYEDSTFLRPGVVREKLRQYGFTDTGLGVAPIQ